MVEICLDSVGVELDQEPQLSLFEELMAVMGMVELEVLNVDWVQSKNTSCVVIQRLVRDVSCMIAKGVEIDPQLMK